MKNTVSSRVATLLKSAAAIFLGAASCLGVAGEEAPGAPWYQQNLALLKASDAVRPPAIPVHPVTAAYNREAIIPPMCYTQTEGRYNPCYVCHQDALPGRENTMGDGALQIGYSFSDLGLTNHWKNLFEDRSERVAAISDAEILDWIDGDNYSELAPRLEEAGFKGWIPDLDNLQESAAAFDAQGFARDGSRWVAFNYKPFPSTFWPTNGSTDDVMIRLAPAYRSDREGHYSRDVYLVNLAVTEANLKQLDAISTFPVDERKLGLDLDGDGELGVVERITRLDGYVGRAADHFLQRGTYPQGTEFLHTVRYVGIGENGEIRHSRRMKEVRYLKKQVAQPLVVLRENYREEGYAKDAGYLPGYNRVGDWGLDNGMGWSVSGFIEDRHGRLRAYTFEENLSCMGCHNSIGSTIDKTFAFPRKPDGAAGYGYIDLHKLPDAPNRGEHRGEYLTYLERVGGGGEFRSNPEMRARWFNADGSVKRAALESVASIYEIITPSVERALQLDKAYRVIVEDQDYIFGKDATVRPPHNVYREVSNTTAPTLPLEKFHDWDIRLDWGSGIRLSGRGAPAPPAGWPRPTGSTADSRELPRGG